METSTHRIVVGRTVAHSFLRSMVQKLRTRSSTIHSIGNIRARAVELTELTDHRDYGYRSSEARVSRASAAGRVFVECDLCIQEAHVVMRRVV